MVHRSFAANETFGRRRRPIAEVEVMLVYAIDLCHELYRLVQGLGVKEGVDLSDKCSVEPHLSEHFLFGVDLPAGLRVQERTEQFAAVVGVGKVRMGEKVKIYIGIRNN